MQVDLFRNVENRFDISKCGICLEPLQTQDRIVQIACTHIFHEDCYSSYYKQCLYCHKKIEDFTVKTYSTEYLEQLREDIRYFINELLIGYSNRPEYKKCLDYVSSKVELCLKPVDDLDDEKERKLNGIQESRKYFTILKAIRNRSQIDDVAFIEDLKEKLWEYVDKVPPKESIETLGSIISLKAIARSNSHQQVWKWSHFPMQEPVLPFIEYVEKVILDVLTDDEIHIISDVLVQKYRAFTIQELSQKTLIKQIGYLRTVNTTEMGYIKDLPEVAYALKAGNQEKKIVIGCVAFNFIVCVLRYLFSTSLQNDGC